jgi:hypothetical protein
VATSDFLASTTTIYKFSQYPASGSSVAAFSTTFNTDWSAALGGTVQGLATSAAPTVAIFIIPNGPVLVVNPGDWAGFNNGVWQSVPNSKMAGLLFTPTTN